MQRTVVYPGSGEVVVVSRIVTLWSKVRDDVSGICGKGDRSGEVRLLPTGGCFVLEGYGSQKCSVLCPDVAAMGSRVGGPLVEADAEGISGHLAAELHAEFHGGRVWVARFGRYGG